MIEKEILIEIPFHDVDAMRIVWHGHYLKYFEIARCALLAEIDYDIPQMEASGYAWPVIDTRIRYAQPIRYQQKIRILARLVEWENRLKVDYEIRDLESGRRLTKAYTVQVAVEAATGEMLLCSPDVLLDKLGVAE